MLNEGKGYPSAHHTITRVRHARAKFLLFIYFSWEETVVKMNRRGCKCHVSSWHYLWERLNTGCK